MLGRGGGASRLRGSLALRICLLLEFLISPLFSKIGTNRPRPSCPVPFTINLMLFFLAKSTPAFTCSEEVALTTYCGYPMLLHGYWGSGMQVSLLKLFHAELTGSSRSKGKVLQAAWMEGHSVAL